MLGRAVAVAAVGAAALLVLGTGALAQAYPPPPVSITVDPSQPTVGQDVSVVITGCRPGTAAIVGVDTSAVGSPTAGSDGTALAMITLPAGVRPGRHVVTGACAGPNGDLLVVSTRIDVRSLAGDGSAAGPAPTTGVRDGRDRDADTTRDGATGGSGGGVDGGSSAGGPGGADGSHGPGDAVTRTADHSGPGTMSTVVRVAFGLLALCGVPVAMALSRRRGAEVFTGRFATQQ